MFSLALVRIDDMNYVITKRQFSILYHLINIVHRTHQQLTKLLQQFL